MKSEIDEELIHSHTNKSRAHFTAHYYYYGSVINYNSSSCHYSFARQHFTEMFSQNCSGVNWVYQSEAVAKHRYYLTIFTLKLSEFQLVFSETIAIRKDPIF